jgi:hypothetical protein
VLLMGEAGLHDACAVVHLLRCEGIPLRRRYTTAERSKGTDSRIAQESTKWDKM